MSHRQRSIRALATERAATEAERPSMPGGNVASDSSSSLAAGGWSALALRPNRSLGMSLRTTLPVAHRG